MIAVWLYSGTANDGAKDRLCHHVIRTLQDSGLTHVVVQVGSSVLTHGRNQTSFWAVADMVKDYAPPKQVLVLAESTDRDWTDLRTYEGLSFSWQRTLWNQVVRKLRLPKWMMVDHINCVELSVMVLRHLGYDISAYDLDTLEVALEEHR